DHVRIASIKVIDHAIDPLFVSGNDARRENNRVAWFDLRVLVIVHSRARQGRHRLALRPADEYADLLRSKIADLARMNQRSFGNMDIAEIKRYLSSFIHGTTDESQLTSVLEGHIRDELYAVYRR